MRLSALDVHLPKSVIFIIGLLATVLMWALDYLLLGPVITFTLLYLIPIAWVTWLTGKANGIVLSLISTAGWSTAYIAGNPSVLFSFSMYLNIVVKFSLYAVFVYVFAALKRSLERERELSRTDYLTGVANRRAFMDALKAEKSRADRTKRPLTVAYFDVDNFKAVNDTYGHPAGNELLCLTAQTIQRNLRVTDTLARMGGDEFAILLPELDRGHAAAAINKIQRYLTDLMRNKGWPVTFSFGVLTCTDPRYSIDALISEVDRVMYAAKQSGKDRIRYEECAPAQRELAGQRK